ncbi:40S ribosomal protein S9 [Xylariomycetidae sp. FL0641]|nr:40S ribosomal protein S9 [Xylariomycetidae sp. FL0641]
MSTLRYVPRCLRTFRASAKQPWRYPTICASSKAPSPCASRTITTTPRRCALETRGSFDRVTDQALTESWDQPLEGEENGEEEDDPIAHVKARALPVSPSYFSRQPEFMDAYVLVQDLARKYGRLPTAAPGQAERVSWKTRHHYRLAVGEQVKARDYANCLTLAKRLHQIHPGLMPEAVKEGIRPFKRDINVYANTPRILPIDKFGRSHGVGRRKSSVARAWLVEGTGEVLINGKGLNDAFGRVHDRESALWGLKSMERLDKYNVWALVEGGGTTGQAEALAMAVAKALCVHEPALKTPLRKAGCIARDPRQVERKKPGRVKARKAFTWVKR